MLPFLLIPLCGLADPYAGGSLLRSISEKIPGRAVFWAALVLGGAGYLLCGLFGALAALSWFIWRTPGWKVFGGSAAPKGAKQIAGTFARHLIAAPVLVSAYWGSRDPLIAAMAGVGFAVVATLLACWYEVRVAKASAAGRPIGNENTLVEGVRGLAYGAAVVITCGIIQ